jgi:uncharacterized protein (UPF0332 family)
MDSEFKLYLKRSQNELNLARIIMKVSVDKEIQIEILGIEEEDTYFSAVISHAYYGIFYGAKAYLLTKGIKTKAPEEHKKTFEEFKKLVEKGVIDVELLKIYEEMLIKADTLLHIFRHEKAKRGDFTYRKLPQANLEPAKESIENAKTFFKHMYNLCGEREKIT